MEEFWPFLFFCITIIFSPGPNNIMLFTLGVNYGLRGAMPYMFGAITGVFFVVLIGGLGVGSLLDQSDSFHQVAKYIGIVFMLYIAYKVATSNQKTQKEAIQKPISFHQAMAFQVVNPKLWSFTVSSVATYTSIEGNIYWEVFIISFVNISMMLPAALLWASGGAHLSGFLQKDTYRTRFNYAMGSLIALTALSVLV